MENVLDKSCSCVWESGSATKNNVSSVERLENWLETGDSPRAQRVARICCWAAGMYFFAHVLKAVL